MCKFLGCLPSELYVKHNPTPLDFEAIGAHRHICAEEEAAKIEAMMGR